MQGLFPKLPFQHCHLLGGHDGGVGVVATVGVVHQLPLAAQDANLQRRRADVYSNAQYVSIFVRF
jgi:hypothetical protein